MRNNKTEIYVNDFEIIEIEREDGSFDLTVENKLNDN